MNPLFGVLILVSAVAASDHSSCCSTEDRHEVVRSWQSVWSSAYSGRRTAIGKAIFQHIFDADKTTLSLFKRVNVDNKDSGEFKAHTVRVLNGLDVAINLLYDPLTLDKQLAHLATQHINRKDITATHFKLMAKALEHVLPQVASGFNLDAWRSCFIRIKDGITAGLPA